MSTSDWEPLPRRRTRRRPQTSDIGDAPAEDAWQQQRRGASASGGTGKGGGQSPRSDHTTLSNAVAIAEAVETRESDWSETSARDPTDAAQDRTEQVRGVEEVEPPRGDEQEFEAVGGGGGRMKKENEKEAAIARDAAVTAAVEARATNTRFCGGLAGGAGADGDNFEYLDHTADVQLHSWGDSMERAMEAALAAMFNLMTDIKLINVDQSLTREVEAKGHDGCSLLFSLLDEFLFLFHSEGLVVRQATVVGEVDRETWRVRLRAEGEVLDLSKHPQGTEIKAITYSNMQINEDASGHTNIYVIVDI